MPYAFGDYILTCGEITCQSFGLDRKKTVRKRSFFLAPPALLEPDDQRLAEPTVTTFLARVEKVARLPLPNLTTFPPLGVEKVAMKRDERARMALGNETDEEGAKARARECVPLL